MILYADVLFAVDFIMDALSLYVCARVMGLRCKGWRLAAAAALGGAYSLLSVLVPMPAPCLLALTVLFPFGMCFAAFGKLRLSRYLRAVVLFFAVGMLSGGILSALYEGLLRLVPSLPPNAKLPLWLYPVLVAAVFLLLAATGGTVAAFGKRKTVRATLALFGKSIPCRLLVDSGNLLRDPYNGKPVMLISAAHLDAYCGKDGAHRRVEDQTREEMAALKMRFLPVRTAAGETVLAAFPAAGLILADGREASVVAAVDPDGAYQGFDGILPYAAWENAVRKKTEKNRKEEIYDAGRS